MRVELRGVTKRFGAVLALDGLDLSLDGGKRVALIGPNGSGKSTLTRVLMGLARCEGEVLLDGHRPSRERVALARKMAYVPQITPAFAAPVNDVIRSIAHVRALKRDDVAALCQQLALDLDAIGRRAFKNLSGGMKQKLLIAIAFAAPFSLLVLDEPTASLDPGSRERFYRLYHERTGAATVILCSHRLEEVRHLVDHVVALDEGQLAYDGSADDFLGQRAISMIEVRMPAANGRAAWLQGLGFEEGLSGWWVKRTTQDEKLRLLPQLSAELGDALQNVIVRDLESVDDRGEPS